MKSKRVADKRIAEAMRADTAAKMKPALQNVLDMRIRFECKNMGKDDT